MKRESRILLEKAINSLILSIEHFNGLSDRGRTEAVLILLDHSYEMFLKAAILHKGGKIRDKRAKQTIGFDECVRRALSDGKIKFITEEQALTLQAVNGVRDAAQHHILDLSEQSLYLYAQSGLTLFRNLLQEVFGRNLNHELPERVLPVSTKPPKDISGIFQTEVDEVRELLAPKKRHKVEALAKVRGLAILDSSLRGSKSQPSVGDLKKMIRESKMDRPGMQFFLEWPRWRSLQRDMALQWIYEFRKRTAFLSSWFQQELQEQQSWLLRESMN